MVSAILRQIALFTFAKGNSSLFSVIKGYCPKLGHVFDLEKHELNCVLGFVHDPKKICEV